MVEASIKDARSIHYGHRTVNGTEVYFISDQTASTQFVTPEFRVTGLQPELWEATTGYMHALPAYDQTNNRTSVPLKLAPYESVFVVFRKTGAISPSHSIEANYPAQVLFADLKGPWIVNFDSSQRGPASPVVFDTLMDWTKSANDAIKYYSGTAYYDLKFKSTAA